MSITANQVTLGTAATLICAATKSDKAELTITTKTKDVWIGESDVTITNGLHLQAGQTITVKIGRNDDIYGVVDSSTHTVSYLLYQPN